MGSPPREFRWVASAIRDLAKLPEDVKRVMGYALWLAQSGEKHPDAKPKKGFGGGGVLEVVEDHDGNTYRAIYTLKFKDSSKQGNKTPRADIDLIQSRLRLAQQDYEERQKKKEQDK